MSSLAVASLVQSGLDLRWIPVQQSVYAGIVTLTLPVLLPLLACVLAYLARDASAGTAAAVVGATWLALGIVQVVAPPSSTNGALGLALIAAAGALFLSALAISAGKPLVGALFAMAALRYALTGVYQLDGDPSLRLASGIVGLAVLCVALYALIAFELEEQYHHRVLPTFRRDATHVGAGGAEALDPGFQDAGVRPTT